MIGGILFLSYLFVCLFFFMPVVNFYLHYNVLIVKDRDFKFGMHTPLMTAFLNDTKVNDLDFDIEAKNSFLDFVAAGA